MFGDAATVRSARTVVTFRVFRDVVTFLAGLALAGYEIVTTAPNGEPSLVVLGLAATMMGLPGTLGIDRLLNRGEPPPPPESPESERGDDEPPDLSARRRHAR